MFSWIGANPTACANLAVGILMDFCRASAAVTSVGESSS